MSRFQLGAESAQALQSIARAGGVRVHFRTLPAGERGAVVGKAHLLIGAGLLVNHHGDPELADGDRTFSLTDWGRTTLRLLEWASDDQADDGRGGSVP